MGQPAFAWPGSSQYRRGLLYWVFQERGRGPHDSGQSSVVLRAPDRSVLADVLQTKPTEATVAQGGPGQPGSDAPETDTARHGPEPGESVQGPSRGKRCQAPPRWLSLWVLSGGPCTVVRGRSTCRFYRCGALRLLCLNAPMIINRPWMW